MARATTSLVHALRTTAARLSRGGGYKWSHFGQCNCGNLAQTITQLSPAQLQALAYQGPGDWGEQARDYCRDTGYPLDYVLDALFAQGLLPQDVRHLERLSDPAVLKRLGVASLRHTRRADVVRYMLAWAELLEAQLPQAEPAPLAAE